MSHNLAKITHQTRQWLLIVIAIVFSCNSFSTFSKYFKISAPNESKYFPEIELLITNVYQKLNIKTEIVRMPAKRAFVTALKSDWVDAELARIAAVEKLLPDYIRVPISLLALDINSYSVKPEVEISSWQSLSGYKVVILRGFVGITSKLEQHNIDYFETGSIKQAIAMIKADRADVAIMHNALINEQDKISLQSDIFFKMNKLDQMNLYHFIHKKHSKLVPQFTIELEKLLQSDKSQLF